MWFDQCHMNWCSPGWQIYLVKVLKKESDMREAMKKYDCHPIKRGRGSVYFEEEFHTSSSRWLWLGRNVRNLQGAAFCTPFSWKGILEQGGERAAERTMPVHPGKGNGFENANT